MAFRRTSKALLASSLFLAYLPSMIIAGGPFAGRRGDDDAPFGKGQVNGGVYGQRSIGGLTEKIEGCFDRFDSEFTVRLGRADINNKRCQAICTDRGYALAATGFIDSCFCGNDYPSIFHRVDTSLCNNPCNPDKVTCFSFTCCGSRDANLLTVSWSGEMDIMLQLLRQLSHDYRFNNPTFRSKIEGGFTGRAALQLMPPPYGRQVVVVEEGGDGGEEGGEGKGKWGWRQQQNDQPLYLAIGDGCPVGWKLFDRWCYNTKWAQASTYSQAVKVCQDEDAELVTVSSEAENKFVTEQLGGCQGWLGIKAMRTTADDETPSSSSSSAVGSRTSAPQPTLPPLMMGNDSSSGEMESLSSADVMSAGRRKHHHHPGRKAAALLWMASHFDSWRQEEYQEKGEESGAVVDTDDVLIEADDAFGPTLKSKESRTRFDEYYPGVHRVQSISMGFKADGEVSSLQLTYRKGDSSVVAGYVHGHQDASTTSTTLRLEDGDDITLISAYFGQWRIQSLHFHIRLANGTEVVHGVPPTSPNRLGGLGWRQLDHKPSATIVGLFGNVGALGNLLSLGFYTGNSLSCSKMDGSGNWTRSPCFSKDEDRSQYVCEKPFLDFRKGCEREWVAWQTSCYLRRRGRGLSWWDARSACQSHGAHLVAINSAGENDFINQLMGGSEGFIGYYRKQHDHGRRWHWDSYWKFADEDTERALTSPFSVGRRQQRLNSIRYDGSGKEVGAYARGDGGGEEEGEGVANSEHCFEMMDDGRWALVSCDLSRSANVICERGSPNATCSECPWPGEWEAWGCTCYHRQVIVDGGTRKSWMQANQICDSMGARLVTIRSGEENEWVREFAKGAFVFRTGRLPTYLALNSLRDAQDYEWGYYDNWRSRRSTSKGAQQRQKGMVVTNTTDLEDLNQSALVSGSSAAGTSSSGPEGGVVDKHYVNWQPKRCAQLSRSGMWVATPCEEHKASCFVCKRERAAAFISLRPQYEEWDLEVVDQPPTPDPGHLHRPPGSKCPDCFRAFLRHSLTGQYLSVDAQNLVYMSQPGVRDPAWSAFTVVAHPQSGGLALVTPHGDAALRWGNPYYPTTSGRDGAFYGLHCEPLSPGWDIVPNRRGGDHLNHGKGVNNKQGSWSPDPLPIFEEDGLVVVRPNRQIAQMAWRYLSISVVAQSRDLNEPGLRECSIAVYDTTPDTLSYECHMRPAGYSDNLVWLEQEALLFFDQSTYAQPRVPLPNGRVRCENGSPTETATCTFAYGQGLTLSRQFRVNWGYTTSDVITHRVNAALTQTALFRVLPKGKNMKDVRGGKELNDLMWTVKDKMHKREWGMRTFKPTPAPQVTDLTISASELAEFVNAFSVAYNNFYEILITKAYVETRNWQLSVPVAPHTTDTIQFWLSSENLYYRWRSLFAARGGFTISAFGVPIGSHHSLGDLTYFRDLFFFIFGSYEFPAEAEIIITVNDIPGDGWPLPTPETSQGDRIGNVVRNGNIGFGYGRGGGPGKGAGFGGKGH